MAQGGELSIRGDGPWGGVTYETKQQPAGGLFRLARGLMVSRDGTELRRWPGMALAARPGYAEGIYWGAVTDTGTDPTEFVINPTGPVAGLVSPYGGVHLMEDDDVNYEWPVFVQLRSSGNVSNLRPGWHLARQSSSGTNPETKIGIEESAAGNNFGVSNNEDQAWVSRLNGLANFLTIHDMIDCLGLPVIVYDASAWFDATQATSPVRQWGLTEQPHLAAMVGQIPLSFDAPSDVTQFHSWPSVPLKWLLQDIEWARDEDNNYQDVPTEPWAPYNLPGIPRKCQLEVYDGRVIIAAPGYGCMFECDLKDELLAEFPWGLVTEKGVVECLGVPKAALHFGGLSFTVEGSGKGQYSTTSTVIVAACYYNSATSTYGLLSETISGTPSQNDSYATIRVAVPRWVLRESAADHVVVFATTGASITMAAKRIAGNVHADYHSGSGPGFQPYVEIDFGTEDGGAVDDIPNIKGTIVPPKIPQMPMGAAWAKTVKGHLFSGGRFGPEDTVDQSVEQVLMDETGVVAAINDPWLVAGKGVPPAYQGTQFLPAEGSMGKAALERLNICQAATPYLTEWAYQGNTPAPPGNFQGEQYRPIAIPKGHVQFSEKERPGETPAVSRVIFDRMEGKDVIGAGKIGDSLVLGTNEEIYALSWGRSPLMADPVLVSTTFEFIAPVTVETDVGLIAMSKRGPILCTPQPQWIGKPVAKRFKEVIRDLEGQSQHGAYKTDDDGMMFSLRMIHDAERRGVWFLLRSDRVDTEFADAADNPAKSKVGADDVLFFAYDTGAWTTWEHPGDLKWLGGGEMTFDDGLKRVAMVTGQPAATTHAESSDAFMLKGDVFGTSDDYFDRLQDPPLYVADQVPIDVSGDTYFKVRLQVSGTLVIGGTGFPVTCSWSGGAQLTDYEDGELFEVTITGSNTTPTIDGTHTAERVSINSFKIYNVTLTVATGGGTATWGAPKDKLRWDSTGSAPYECRYPAFIRSAAAGTDGNYELKWWGYVDAMRDKTGANRSQLRCVNPDYISATPTWVVGDVLEVGTIHMEMETLLLSLDELAGGEAKQGHLVRGVVLEHQFTKNYNPRSRPKLAWAYVEGWADDPTDRRAGAWTKMHPETWGHPLLVDREISRIQGGQIRSRETSMRIAIVSNCFTSLKDIRLDLAAGEGR